MHVIKIHRIAECSFIVMSSIYCLDNGSDVQGLLIQLRMEDLRDLVHCHVQH